MSAGTISLILNIALLVFVLFGFLAGLVRGAKKSGVRTIWLVIFLALVLLLSPIISQSLMGIYIGPLENTLGGYLQDQILAIPEIADIYNSNEAMQELVLKLPPMLLNLVVVLLLVLVSWIISGICYLITKAIMNRKAKKSKEGKVYTVMNGRPVVIEKNEKPKKYRFWGGVIGAVGGLVMCFCLFLPITGTVRTVMQYIDTAQPQVASAEDGETAFEFKEVSKKLTDLMGEEVIGYLQAVNNSILVKITSVGNLDLALYDGISTVNVGGQKVCLRNEVNAVATAYETVLYVETLQDENGNIDFQNLDFDKLENTVNAIFSSGLVKSIGISTVETLIDDAVNGDLLDTLVTDEKIDEKIAGYAKEVLNQIQIATQQNGLSNTLKNDLLAILNVAQAVVKSGLLEVATNIEEFNKQAVTDIAACLNGTHELSAENEHDYLHDITENLFTSQLLKASLVGAVNIGTTELKAVLEDMLSDQEQDITGENAVVFSKAIQTAVDWTKVATAFESILENGITIAGFYADVEALQHKDVDYILRLEGSENAITSAGKVLDTLQNFDLLTKTEGGASIFNEALDQFNRLDYINKYADLAELKTISWQQEFTPITQLITFAKPALWAESGNTFTYKTLDYASLTEQNTFANLFGGQIFDAVKTTEFKTELLDKGLGEDLEKILTTLLDDTEKLSDLESTLLAVTGAAQPLAKAGVIEFMLDDDKTALDVNALIASLMIIEEAQTNMRIQTAVEKLFSDDKLCKIYIDFVNQFIEDKELDIGEIVAPQNFTTFSAQTIQNLNTALPLVMSVYLDLNITDFDNINLEEDGVMAIFDLILTDNFAGANGNAFKIGAAMDILTNSVCLNATKESEVTNILRKLIYDNLGEVDMIDREIILTTTDNLFWQSELMALAPTLVLLNSTYSDSTETQTLLEVLMTQGGTEMTETDGFKNLTDAQVEQVVNTICESKLLRPAAIELLETLATTLGQMFDEDFECTILENADLAAQKSQIANVILKALALQDIDISAYDSIAQAVLESQDVQTALKNLLIALNANEQGIFGGVYTLVFDMVETTISDANLAMINLVDGEYSLALEIGFDALIEQYDALLDVMKKAKTLADLNAENFDALLDMDGAKDVLYDLLFALDQNKTGAFGTATTKIFDYFADIIITASDEMIALVDSEYVGALEVPNLQILTQFNSVLDILKKADAVADLGANSIETLLDTTGGDAALQNLLVSMQDSVSGVFGAAYTEIFEYMQTTYAEVLTSLQNVTPESVVWADVLSEYQDFKSSIS